MSRPLTAGIYRVRQDVAGPLGTARIERDATSRDERYTVRFYKREAPTGALVAICYRYAIPETHDAQVATYDGGWVRALAIAEDYTLGSAHYGASSH